MIFEDRQELGERIERLTGRHLKGEINVFEDTSQYVRIDGNSVVRLSGMDYFILSNAMEGRFGIDDQPKFWVKHAIDLTTGERKIIKLVFHEQFTTLVGPVTVRCTRMASKESAILDLIRGQARFMQGLTVADASNNNVRIIDHIPGQSLYQLIEEMQMPHEQYAAEVLPAMMAELIPCIEAIALLHRHGQHHGDIRNDHIVVDSRSGRYTWIDFDYHVNFADYDVWAIGNVLTYLVGKGLHTFREVQRDRLSYRFATGLDDGDSLVLYSHRIANLKKLFPWVPRELNEVLMRFSVSSRNPYVDVEEQVRDLRRVYPET